MGLRWVAAGLAAAAFGAFALTGCDRADGPRATTVEVSRGVCGDGWTDPHGGRQAFRVHNVGIATTEVQLVDPATGGVYAEIEGLAPGSTATMRVRLARGRYAFKCLPEDTDALTGATVTVRDGPRRAGAAVRPVTRQELYRPTLAYRDYVSSAFGTLRRHVAALDTAVRAGDRPGARSAWLTAHLDYERLGAAYGTFGDAGDAVDGLPAGLADGVHDKDFTGFHRVEYGLWHGESMRALARATHRLVTDVATLVRRFPDTQTDPTDLPLRAHEILEGTLEFELTGKADLGSGTTLATARANVDGTRAVLAALAPVLRDRYPAMPRVDRWLDRLTRLLDAARHDGRWTPVAELSHDDRQRLDAAIGQALELLAPVAALAEPRRAR